MFESGCQIKSLDNWVVIRCMQPNDLRVARRRLGKQVSIRSHEVRKLHLWLVGVPAWPQHVSLEVNRRGVVRSASFVFRALPSVGLPCAAVPPRGEFLRKDRAHLEAFSHCATHTLLGDAPCLPQSPRNQAADSLKSRRSRVAADLRECRGATDRKRPPLRLTAFRDSVEAAAGSPVVSHRQPQTAHSTEWKANLRHTHLV